MGTREHIEFFDKSFVEAVNRYLDIRENELSADIELDKEILREVTALYRVVQYLRSEDAIRPLPQTLKRIIHLKRDINHIVSREASTKAGYSSSFSNFR